MIESELSARITPDEPRAQATPAPVQTVAPAATANVAFVPGAHGGKYAGYLHVMASAEGPVVAVPGIIGGLDDTEPDSASAEALIGRPIGPWVQGPDGWYAEIK